MITKDEILGALPTLDRAGLEAIHAMTAALLGGATAAQSNGVPDTSQAIFTALASALGASISYPVVPVTKTERLFKQRIPDFTTFLDTNFKGWDANKTTQLAFLRMLFTLIKDDLQKRNVTPSVGMVVSNMIRIRDVFENAFPGYLSNGMGEVILKRFK